LDIYGPNCIAIEEISETSTQFQYWIFLQRLILEFGKIYFSFTNGVKTYD